MSLTFERCVSDVAEFHAKFGIDVNPLDDAAQRDLRIKRQGEEMDERQDAENSADEADAVIDTIYIAAGTFQLLGNRDGSAEDHDFLRKDYLRGIFSSLKARYCPLPLEALWEEVHAANMRKERGTEGTSKYGNKYDIVKPEGWVAPDIAKVMREHGLDPESPRLTYFNEGSCM